MSKEATETELEATAKRLFIVFMQTISHASYPTCEKQWKMLRTYSDKEPSSKINVFQGWIAATKEAMK